MNLYFAVFLITVLVSNPVLSHAQSSTGSAEIFFKYKTGDKASVDDLNLKIYRGFETNVFQEIKTITSNPFTIASLPIGYDYKIEAYTKGIYVGVGIIKVTSANQNFDLIVSSTGGLVFTVVYNDGVTPIEGASVVIKSNDGQKWKQDITDEKGKTSRVWIPSISRDTDYYYADISVGPNLVYTFTPIKLPSGQQEFKVVTKWPAVINNLVTIDLYQTPTAKVEKTDGEFVVELADLKNATILRSQVNSKGQAFFSDFKVGSYVINVIKKAASASEDLLVAKKVTTISGDENTIKVFLNNPELNIETNSGDNHINCNCVAFRLDDVQDSSLNNVQEAIITTFQKHNASLTLAVIAGAFGNDQKLVTLIKNRLAEGNPPLEIASHSYSHPDMSLLTKSRQTDELIKSTQKLSSVFGITPNVFVPPFNHFNKDTIDSMKEQNYTHLSYHIEWASPPVFQKSSFYHFPATTETSAEEIQKKPEWRATPNDVLFQNIRSSLLNYGYAVVMMHSKEYAMFIDGFYKNQVNQTQLAQLELMIEKIKSEGLTILPIGHIENYDEPLINPKPPADQDQPLHDCNCVAFRLDNVQDFYLNNVQTEIMNAFQENNASLTVGLLGKGIGSDTKIVNMIKQKLSSNPPTIALANRGWENVDHSQYGKSEQSASLKKSSDKILQVFGMRPSIYIPVLNKFNNETFDAMYENGVRYFSAVSSSDPPPYDLRNAVPFHLPQTIAVKDLVEDSPFITGGKEKNSLSKVQTSLSLYGFAVITMRTQDFAAKETDFINEIDAGKLQTLKDILGYLKRNGVEIVTLDQIPNNVTDKKSPAWLESVYSWYVNGEISRTEVLNAVKFLIEKNIIKFEA